MYTVSSMNAQRRAAALLEVLGVYLAGQLVTGQLVRLLGVSPANPLTGLCDVVHGVAVVHAHPHGHRPLGERQ